MSIPISPISIDLQPNTPTQLTPEVLGAQLNAIGLSCKYTTPPILSKLIEDADPQIPNGTLESFRLLMPTTNQSKRIDGFVQDYEVSSQGNWTVKDTPYDPILEYIQYPTHFEWLLATYPSFTGISEPFKTYNIKASTVDAIKNFFIDTLTTASSVVLKGINKATLYSILSNVLNVLPTNLKDYNESSSRTIFLVDNYDPNTKMADAIGIVGLNWTLTIKDYQVKKQALSHDTTVTVQARGIMYSSIDQMNTDYGNAKTHFGHKSFQLFDIPVPTSKEIKIFSEQPPANADTFQNSLPLISKTEYMDCIVMFSPDLQSIASIDNTSSGNVATYLKSVATGYIFTATQNISTTAGFSVTLKVVKANFSVTFSFGFSEQWSTLVTETINFTVPAGKNGFLFQGTLVSRILRYDPKYNNYVYMDMGLLKTSVFAITDVPILPNAKVEFVAL